MKFRKKPVEVEAFQVTQDFIRSSDETFWIGDREIFVCGSKDDDYATGYLMIPTLEGDMKADIGDWVITGVKGEAYPCKPDIFEATYERVLE